MTEEYMALLRELREKGLLTDEEIEVYGFPMGVEVTNYVRGVATWSHYFPCCEDAGYITMKFAYIEKTKCLKCGFTIKETGEYREKISISPRKESQYEFKKAGSLKGDEYF